MLTSPIIAYILICLALFIPYPKYSLLPLNLIGNIVIGVLLYYLSTIGWKRIAWAIVVIPLLLAVFSRSYFDKYARSFEENKMKSKK
jgi:hypothetical protein